MNNDGVAIEVKFKNSVTGKKKLEEYAETLTTINGVVGNLTKDQSGIKNLEKTSGKMKDTSDNVSNMAKKVSLAFDYNVISKFTSVLGKAWKTMWKYSQVAGEYYENWNLFQVAFKSDTEEATKIAIKGAKEFTDSMSKMFGLDESWVLRTTGLFKQMANAMGLAEETGTKLSKLMVQMSLDISSLYNTDIERASSVLQSSLAGQTKPIRGLTGGDITQASLQKTLDNLGIDKQIANLSYAEKRLTIIISLTNQLAESIGDMGRTIESPANQTRVLASQWERLTRAVGDVFLPIVAKILPYLNAILMVLTEIISMVASWVANSKWFKFDKKQFDVSGVKNMGGYVDDLAEGLDTASDNAKKLKQGLRGFDKLNNITTPTDTGAGASVGAGGIDEDILNAFDEAYANYQEKFEEIKMKATEIAEKMRDWLGITDGTYKNLKLIGVALGGLLLVEIEKIGKALGLIPKDLTIASILGLDSTTMAIIGGVIVAIGLLALAIYDLYNNNEDFRKKFDETWGTMGEKIQPIIDKLGELWVNIAGFNSILSVLIQVGREIWEIIKTIAETLSDILYPIVDEVIIPVIEKLIGIINDIIEIIIELWGTYGKPISEAIQEAIRGIEDIFNELWVQFLHPIITQIMKIIDDLWENTFKPMFKKLGEVIGELVLTLLALWNNILKPIVMWVIDFLYPKIETIVSRILDKVHNAIKTIGGIINGLLDILKGLLQFLTGVFTGNWEKAWEGILNIGRGFGNVFISIFEGMINGIIAGLNNFIKTAFNGVKSLVNKIGGVIEGLASILGKNIDITMTGSAPRFDLITLPRLKKGMEYVPTDFYPAYLDKGERVLTAQENRDYKANKQSVETEYKEDKKPQTYNIYVGTEKISTVVLKDLNRLAKIEGRPIEINA